MLEEQAAQVEEAHQEVGGHLAGQEAREAPLVGVRGNAIRGREGYRPRRHRPLPHHHPQEEVGLATHLAVEKPEGFRGVGVLPFVRHHHSVFVVEPCKSSCV